MNSKVHGTWRQGIALLSLVLVAAVFGAVSCLGPTGIEIAAVLKVSVVLNLNGADIEGYQLILEPGPNGTVARPKQDPVRKGYSFAGWYADEAGTAPFDFPRTIVTGATVIYAKWDEIIRIVRFFSNDGSGEEYDPQEVLDSHYAVWPALPIRTGYGFTGWFTDAAGTETARFAFEQPVTADQTLYAKWGNNGNYFLYYYDNYDGGGATPVEVVSAGNVVLASDFPKPSRPGEYTFGGWYETEACTGSPWPGGTLYADKTLYAKWNGGLPASFPTKVAYGTKAVPPSEPARAGYRFTGWYTAASGGNPANFAQSITRNQTFYAQWQQFHTITLVRIGTGEVAYREVNAGDAFPLPSAAQLGWDAAAKTIWYDDLAQKKALGSSITPYKDVTLYGQVGSAPPPVYTLMMVRLTTAEVESELVEANASFTLPGAETLGWSGDGDLNWYQDANYSLPSPSTISMSADTVVFALFSNEAVEVAGSYYALTTEQPDTFADNPANVQIKTFLVPAGTAFTLPTFEQLQQSGWPSPAITNPELPGAVSVEWYGGYSWNMGYWNRVTTPTYQPVNDQSRKVYAAFLNAAGQEINGKVRMP